MEVNAAEVLEVDPTANRQLSEGAEEHWDAQKEIERELD